MDDLWRGLFRFDQQISQFADGFFEANNALIGGRCDLRRHRSIGEQGAQQIALVLIALWVLHGFIKRHDQCSEPIGVGRAQCKEQF